MLSYVYVHRIVDKLDYPGFADDPPHTVVGKVAFEVVGMLTRQQLIGDTFTQFQTVGC